MIQSSLTNELGAFGKITLLKNNAGMFIANCLRKELCAAYGREVPWSEITQMAESAKGEVFIDLNDIRFLIRKVCHGKSGDLLQRADRQMVKWNGDFV